MTKPNTPTPSVEGWRADLQTAVAAAIRHCLDLGYDADRIAAELAERNLLAGEPCTISCACGTRTVPWPREVITVECETCGAKHAIAPLMDNHRSTIDHLNHLYDKNRQLRDRIRELEEPGEPGEIDVQMRYSDLASDVLTAICEHVHPSGQGGITGVDKARDAIVAVTRGRDGQR